MRLVSCYCETCHNKVKMRKWMRNGADPRSGCGTDMGIKCGTAMDTMRHFNEFFASYLRFCVLDLCFFCNGCNVKECY
jgi:hypothetical protein